MPTVQHHMEKLGTYIQPVADTIGAVVATGAITLPWWRQSLHTASGIASDTAPIIGITWLLVQIVHRVVHWSGKPASTEKNY